MDDVVTEWMGQFDRMLNCSQAVLDTYADAWAALMTNPYQFSSSHVLPGPYDCLAVRTNGSSCSHVAVKEAPHHMLCILKGALS